MDLTRLELLAAAGVRSVLRAEQAACVEHVRLQLVITRRAARMLRLLDLHDQLCLQPDQATARRAAV